MSTFNNVSFQDPRNINLKGSTSQNLGIIRWDPSAGTGWTTNPVESTAYGLYINSSGNLVFSSLGSTTTLGAAGSGSGVPSWDAIYAGDQSLAISGSTLTFDGTHASNNVVTISDSGAGSGHLLQITNTGSGKDIRGTSGTWDVSALGAMTGLTLTLAGTAASTSLALTLGNIVTSAGGISLTKAANNATLSMTNNTATTASVIVLAGSGAFTGSTTSSFATLTASGLTTGTVLYVPAAALTQGKVIDIVANALTSGILVDITSSATAITGAGRLLRVDHTGITGSTAILSEFASAANDETVIVKVTASDVLATGKALQVSVSAMTTGTAIDVPNLDALTTGIGLNLASAATAITSGGRIFLSSHTGLTGTSAVLNEFISSANDETKVLQVKAASLTSGTLLVVSGALVDSGKGIDMSDINALTTGVGVHIASTSITTTSGSLLRISTGTTGAVATSGIVSIRATADYTSSSNVGLLNVAANSLTAGQIADISGTALTTGIALRIVSSGTGLTSGSLLVVTTGTTGAVATNGIVSIRATGAYTSTSNIGVLDVLASATTAGTVVRIAASAAGQTATELLRVEASGYTTGYTGTVANFIGVSTTGASNVVNITGANTSDGSMLRLTNNALTTGVGFIYAHTTSVIADGGSLMRLSSSSIDTGGATNATILDIATTATVAGTLVTIASSAALQTTTKLLKVIASGYTTGYSGDVASITGAATTGAAASTHSVLKLTGTNTTGGSILNLTNNALTTGVGILFAHTTSVIADGGSMLRLSSSSVDTGGATNGTILDISSTGSTAGTFVLVSDTALVDGKAAKIASTSAAYTSANLLKIDLTSSGTLSARTGSSLSVTSSMTHTANANVTENYNDITISRTVIRNTGGADANTTLSQGAMLSLSNTITATTGTITDTMKGIAITMSSSGTGDGLNVTHAATGGIAINVSGAATSVDDVLIAGTGAKANGKGSLRVTNSGATAAGGAVLYVSATGTPAAATSYLAAFDNSGITATNNPSAVFINQKGTGAALAVTAVVQSTHFYKIATMNGVTLWMGDGTTGQANLSATAGDILFNGGTNKPEYCTGTTNWTALV